MEKVILFATYSFVCFIVSYVIQLLVFRLISHSNWKKENYKGIKIPNSMGICFIFFTLIQSTVFILFKVENYFLILNYSFLMVGIGFIGLMDDILSTKSGGGFKGNLATSISSKYISTSLLKAVFIIVISFIISVPFSNNYKYVTIDTILIALSSNFLNLLDLKPGRAIKFYLFSTIIVLLISLFGEKLGVSLKKSTCSFFIPIIICIFVYATFYDFKCKSMLGDTGSNFLGASLGFLLVNEISYINKMLLILILCAFHFISEFVSFSSLIERNKVLKFLDSLFVKNYDK